MRRAYQQSSIRSKRKHNAGMYLIAIFNYFENSLLKRYWHEPQPVGASLKKHSDKEGGLHVIPFSQPCIFLNTQLIRKLLAAVPLPFLTC